MFNRLHAILITVQNTSSDESWVPVVHPDHRVWRYLCWLSLGGSGAKGRCSVGAVAATRHVVVLLRVGDDFDVFHAKRDLLHVGRDRNRQS